MNEVYLITNKVNGKRYVGITCRGYQARFNEHVLEAAAGSPAMLHNAMRKYGSENFDVICIESNIPDEEIEQKEKYYISLYNTFYPSRIGYNMTEGGGGMCGYKHTPEARAKISKNLQGHVFPESRNMKISKANKGVPKTAAHRKALSEARKGKYTKEQNPFYGKHHSEYSKSLVSKANSKYTVYRLSDEYEVLQVYNNYCDAGRWVVSSGRSKADPLTCAIRITEVCNGSNAKCKAYGFHWKHEKGPSTNCRGEDELHPEA